MRVFATGGTGYIGGVVTEALRNAGHDVFALARSDGAERRLRARRFAVVRGDLADTALLERYAGQADAVVHVANTGGSDAGAADEGAADAFVRALRGTGNPLLYTSGVWVLGPGDDVLLDENAPRRPIPLVAWRAGLEEHLGAATSEGVRSVVIRPALAYGRAGGIPAMLVREARETGVVRVVGDGRQEWPFVHVDDLAELYVRALGAPPGTVLNAVAGPSYAARDVALAATFAAGTPGVLRSWALEDAHRELGAFASALALHQRVSGRVAQRLLGWRPAGPSLLEELLAGSYATRERGRDAGAAVATAGASTFGD